MTTKRLTKNVLFSALASGSNLFLLALTFLATRRLGPEAFGQFSYALAFVTLFTYLTGCSMNLMGTIVVARDPGAVGRQFGNMLSLQTLLSIFTMGLIVVAVGHLTYHHAPASPELQWAIYLMAGAMLGRAYKQSLRMLFKAFQRFDLESISMVVGQGALFVVGCGVLIWRPRLMPFVAAFAVVRLIDLLGTYVLLQRCVARLAPRFDVALWPGLLRAGALFGLVSVLNEVSFRVDTVMLGFWQPDRQIGFYNAAYKVLEGLIEIPGILCFTLLPALSVAHTRSREEVVALYRRGAHYLSLCALPLAVWLALEAEPVMRLIAGPDYGAAAGTLRLLMLSVPPIFLAWIAWMVLMAIDRTHVALWRALAAVGVNVALNLLVLPRWGIEGAAVVTFLTESVACVLVTGYLFRQGYGFACLDTALKTLTATAAVAAVTWLLGGAPLPLSATAAGFTFLAALWATGDKKKGPSAVLRTLSSMRAAISAMKPASAGSSLPRLGAPRP